MNSIEIKKVTLNDLYELQNISRQTFCETFSDDNTEKDMRKYIDESLSIDRLTSELNNQNSEFYFATLNNIVVGYLKLNYGNAQTEVNDQCSLEIERIYVQKEFHGKQVGQILYNKALHTAKQNNLDYLWLGVWEKNPRAINFTKKMVFWNSINIFSN